MIRVFKAQESNETLESSNGDCIIIPSKAIVHKYENSDYYLELEASSDYSDYFRFGRLLVVDLPSGKEWFRMGNVTRTRGKCKSRCNQVFFDLQWACESFLHPATPPASTTFYGALNWANQRMDDSGDPSEKYNYFNHLNEYTVLDYTVTGETDFPSTKFILRASSMYDYIKNIMKQYGGYLVRNKRTFGISRIRPSVDHGVTIEYGKNAKSITREEDWSDACTILQAYNTEGWAPKRYEKLGAYDADTWFYYQKCNRFNIGLNLKDYETAQAYDSAYNAKYAELGNAYLAQTYIPKIKYTVEASLGEMPNGMMEIQDLGDIIKVKDEVIGVDVTAYVLGYDLDLLTNKFTKVEFGDYVTSMKGFNNRIDEKINAVQEGITDYTHPVGCILQTTGSNPSALGIEGYWELVTSSGGVYVYRRVH